MRLAFAPLVFLVALPAFADDKPPTALADYVGKADKSFAWKQKEKTENNGNTVYLLSLTSQTWQGIEWTHDLQVFVPKGAKPQSTMVLWNQGGKAGATETALGLLIAEKVGAPIAFLYGIPKQPLYKDEKGNLTTTPPNPKDDKEGRLVEDALIAETFLKYLDTKDETWPLLLPMVKSVTRAMDALQAFAKDEWKAEVKQFVITGASKRGWTSWLTAASGDKRVKAIAPLVIDTLDFPTQMKNQVAAFGKPSEMIKDYTERKLVPIPDTAEGKKLWRMIDPYIYRESITVPKMLINGTNDPYWPQDALNSYWDDLKGDKYVCYVPNAGHDLREKDKDGKPELIPTRAINTLAAFGKAQVFDMKMPTMSWKYDEKKAVCTVTLNGTLKASRVWTADSDTRDFRKARWTASEPIKGTGGAVIKLSGPVTQTYTFTPPEGGLRAAFVECECDEEVGTLHLATQIRILEVKK